MRSRLLSFANVVFSSETAGLPPGEVGDLLPESSDITLARERRSEMIHRPPAPSREPRHFRALDFSSPPRNRLHIKLLCTETAKHL